MDEKGHHPCSQCCDTFCKRILAGRQVAFLLEGVVSPVWVLHSVGYLLVLMAVVVVVCNADASDLNPSAVATQPHVRVPVEVHIHIPHHSPVVLIHLPSSEELEIVQEQAVDLRNPSAEVRHLALYSVFEKQKACMRAVVPILVRDRSEGQSGMDQLALALALGLEMDSSLP